jgi:hypothetical protein
VSLVLLTPNLVAERLGFLLEIQESHEGWYYKKDFVRFLSPAFYKGYPKMKDIKSVGGEGISPL